MNTFWMIAAGSFFSGVFTGVTTAAKDRGFFSGLMLGLLLGPIGFIIALCLSSKASKKDDTPQNQQKKCPFCAELIKAEAIVCKYCGRDLPPLPAYSSTLDASEEYSPADSDSTKKGIV